MLGALELILMPEDAVIASTDRDGVASIDGNPTAAAVKALLEVPNRLFAYSSAMKLVVAGKGGSGKTSISGTMARLLARDGHRVLAIDADSNPNLALTLGISPDRMADMPTLPRGLLRRSDQGSQLNQSLEDICRSHSLAGADGVTLLVMAHPQHAGAG